MNFFFSILNIGEIKILSTFCLILKLNSLKLIQTPSAGTDWLEKSKLYESAFTPIIIGLLVGFIAAIMGIGGAFILVPAMIYIIKMPTKLVPGTSLFVTIFVSVIVTFLHSFNYGSIDLMLVVMLVVGSIIGVQVGQKLGERIDSSGLKALLAILLLIC